VKSIISLETCKSKLVYDCSIDTKIKSLGMNPYLVGNAGLPYDDCILNNNVSYTLKILNKYFLQILKNRSNAHFRW
jgi:hypothetical protein